MWQRSVCRTEYTYLRSVRGNQYFGSREKLSGTRQNLYSSRHKAAARRHSGTHPCIVPTHPHTYPQQSTYSPSIPAGRERRQHTFSENVLGGGMSLIILEYRSWCSTFRWSFWRCRIAALQQCVSSFPRESCVWSFLPSRVTHHCFHPEREDPANSASISAVLWTAFSDYTGPDLLCSTVFHF